VITLELLQVGSGDKVSYGSLGTSNRKLFSVGQSSLTLHDLLSKLESTNFKVLDSPVQDLNYGVINVQVLNPDTTYFEDYELRLVPKSIEGYKKDFSNSNYSDSWKDYSGDSELDQRLNQLISQVRRSKNNDRDLDLKLNILSNLRYIFSHSKTNLQKLSSLIRGEFIKLQDESSSKSFSYSTELTDKQSGQTIQELIDKLQAKIDSETDDKKKRTFKMFLGNLKYQAKTFGITPTLSLNGEEVPYSFITHKPYDRYDTPKYSIILNYKDEKVVYPKVLAYEG
jgi:hypothetical protein